MPAGGPTPQERSTTLHPLQLTAQQTSYPNPFKASDLETPLRLDAIDITVGSQAEDVESEDKFGETKRATLDDQTKHAALRRSTLTEFQGRLSAKNAGAPRPGGVQASLEAAAAAWQQKAQARAGPVAPIPTAIVSSVKNQQPSGGKKAGKSAAERSDDTAEEKYEAEESSEYYDQESNSSYLASDARNSEISDDIAAKSYRTYKTAKTAKTNKTTKSRKKK